MGASVSLKTDPTKANQTRFLTLLDAHQFTIAGNNFMTTALPEQLLIFAPELILQGRSFPGGFGQIKPREPGHEVARFHG